MIHPKIFAELVHRLEIDKEFEAEFLEYLSGCVSNAEANKPPRETLRVGDRLINIIDIEQMYSEIESELRGQREIKVKGGNGMGKILTHTQPRNLIVKEVEPSFFRENAIELSEIDNEEFMGSAPPPPAFSLKSGMSEAKNQGSAGTCTSFGVIGCLDYFHGKLDLSEGHITHAAEQAHSDCSEGLALEHAMLIAAGGGVVTEAVWPYDQSKICWANPPSTSGQAHYKFNTHRYVFYRPSRAALAVMEEQTKNGFGLDTEVVADRVSRANFDEDEFPQPANFVRLLKAALAKAGTPVAVSVPVWFSSDNHFDAGWDWGPDIQMPTPVNLRLFLENKSPPNVSGWHVIAVCGYNDSTKRFEFKNSWDWWWGDNGFGTIPYDYITSYARTAMHGWI